MIWIVRARYTMFIENDKLLAYVLNKIIIGIYNVFTFIHRSSFAKFKRLTHVRHILVSHIISITGIWVRSNWSFLINISKHCGDIFGLLRLKRLINNNQNKLIEGIFFATFLVFRALFALEGESIRPISRSTTTILMLPLKKSTISHIMVMWFEDQNSEGWKIVSEIEHILLANVAENSFRLWFDFRYKVSTGNI